MLIAMTVLTGLLYTTAVTVFAQTLFEHPADGSVVVHDDDVVGSAFLGQTFSAPGYFYPRPSAVDYDTRLSGGSNLGPNNPEFLALVAERADSYRETNHLDPDALIPIDAVTASASGLDPHISVANARFQAARIAEARGVPTVAVLELVDSMRPSGSIGYLAGPSINVLLLNIALDDRHPMP
jgi:K+-transporting ATPase ATPase C chain